MQESTNPREAPQADTRPPRYPGTPRWVKVLWIIGVVLILLIVILHVAGHGFGGHTLHDGHH